MCTWSCDDLHTELDGSIGLHSLVKQTVVRVELEPQEENDYNYNREKRTSTPSREGPTGGRGQQEGGANRREGPYNTSTTRFMHSIQYLMFS